MTELQKRPGQTKEQYRILLYKCKLTHALGRPGTVEEVSKAILFLAGPDSSFTTGHRLRIDEGRGIMFPSNSQVKMPDESNPIKDICESCDSHVKKTNEERNSV
ncbi:hypothetical protein PENTCL1PPCAC_3768 [Pristionchus entomophagus]|uniref:Dehydrogenase n=1 Tax=Pristionchus entomophagus TaxID=358040 RepID=A0AAV5SHC4_9BILA|nr:hypothetical protein PENTCL1PPCAC_3768 [Pristionchus entomophagus]